MILLLYYGVEFSADYDIITLLWGGVWVVLIIILLLCYGVESHAATYYSVMGT